MRHFLMYMDESGTASLTSDSQYFVLAGIIVEDKVDNDLSAYLRYLKRRHSIDENTSLHAYDIFEKKDSPLYLTDNQKCKKFTASIAEFFENAPFKVLAFYIDKKELMKKIGAPRGYSFKGNKEHKSDRELGYEILARKLIFDFAKILKKEKAIGSIVAESRSGADKILLKAYITSQNSQIFDNINKKITGAKAKLAKEKIHSICFSSKKSLKGALELVDVVSYCTYNECVKNFPVHRNDSRGIKAMWTRIKTQINTHPQKISSSEMSGLAPDRIHETSIRVKARLAEYRDLVNPT